MLRYKLSNKAQSDLAEIWNYTFDKWSESQADKYYSLLVDAFVYISNNQYDGKRLHGFSEEVYSYKVGRHLLIYRIINANLLEITRILHEKMDLKTKF